MEATCPCKAQGRVRVARRKRNENEENHADYRDQISVYLIENLVENAINVTILFKKNCGISIIIINCLFVIIIICYML